MTSKKFTIRFIETADGISYFIDDETAYLYLISADELKKTVETPLPENYTLKIDSYSIDGNKEYFLSDSFVSKTVPNLYDGLYFIHPFEGACVVKAVKQDRSTEILAGTDGRKHMTHKCALGTYTLTYKVCRSGVESSVTLRWGTPISAYYLGPLNFSRM